MVVMRRDDELLQGRSDMKDIKILAFCGSLRQQSYNRFALEALQIRSPTNVNIHIFDGLADLPFFNPDLQLAIEKGDYSVFNLSDNRIDALESLQQALSQADGLIIASPEYAHGVTGLIKNTLDWLVSGESFINLPIMLINTSKRASHAKQSLQEIVTTMSGEVITEAELNLPLLGSQISSSDALVGSDFVPEIDNALLNFCRHLSP